MSGSVLLLLRMLGLATFLVTALVALVALATSVYALARGDRRLFRVSAAGAAVWLAVYAVLLAAGPALAPSRLLAPGEEISFCGFDCHLHLAVLGAYRVDDGLEVRLRVRSDAKRAPEYPAHLRIRAVDALGREFAPVGGALDQPLVAGAEYTRTLRFALPADAAQPRLVVSWRDWPDWLVPGPEHPLVQRKTAILLEPAGDPNGRTAT